MNLRSLLYKQHYRSHNDSRFRDQIQNNQKQYQKQLNDIQNAVSLMNTAFKNNIKIQEIYLELVKAKTRKVSFKQKDIKNVYRILSENKTGEIIFTQVHEKDEEERKESILNSNTMKDETGLMNISLNASKFKQLTATLSPKASQQNSNSHRLKKKEQKVKFKSGERDSIQISGQVQKKESQHGKNSVNSYTDDCFKILKFTYRRLYSRLAETIIKKMTYYIMNKHFLQKIILHTISELSKKLQTLMRRIFDFHDSKFLYEVIRLIYQENLIIQQKIYQVLVDESYVVSLEEFFRINGIIMTEDPQSIRRRSSRLSVLSTQRLSLLTKDPICLDSLKTPELKSKKSRFSQETKNQPKKKQKLAPVQNPNKNHLHIEKINKQIESKYASALDRLGEIIEKENQELAQFKQKELPSPKKSFDEILKRKKSEQSEEFVIGLDGKPRSKSRKKSEASKRRNSNFQYFSSSFKQIVKQLDQKKGKSSQFMMEAQSHANLMTSSRISSNLESGHFGKINNETISLQNPTSVARLLNKKFKTYVASASDQKIKYSIANNKLRKSSCSTRHNQISKLLKIYENKNKQNHIIDILFGTNFEGQDQKTLQKNFIKLSIMARLKQKKIQQMKGNQLECAQFEDFMMKEIEKEYEELLAKSKSKRLRQKLGTIVQAYCESDTNTKDQPFTKNQQKKRKIVNFDQPQKQTLQKVGLNEEESIFKTQIKKSYLGHALSPQKNVFIANQEDRQKQQSIYRTHRKTHQPKFSQNQSQLASLFETFDCFQPNKFKKLETAYGEFTNPVTKNCGYYNQTGYTMLRSSLEKREINSLVKMKKKGQNRNLFEIGASVTFWNKTKIATHKNVLVTHQNSTLEQAKNMKIPYASQCVTREKKQQKTPKQSGLNIFQHQLLKNYAKWQRQSRPEGQDVFRYKKTKPQKPGQLKILRLQHSKTQRGRLEKMNSLDGFGKENEIHRTITSIKFLQKMLPQSHKSLARDFCLNASKIEKPNFVLNQKDLDGFIEKYLNANNKLQTDQANKGKQNTSKVMKDISRVINSLPISPRNSFKRVKELYSTRQRAKVQ